MADGTLTPVNPTIGQHYFTIAELRARKSELANATTFPDAKLEAARDYAEQRFEALAHAAYLPRTVTETVIGKGKASLFLSAFVEVSAVSAVTVDGVALTATELAALKVRPWGEVINTATWTEDSAIVVTYTHGFTEVPEPVKNATLMLATYHLLPPAIDARATVMTNDVGSFRISIADKTGRTGIPEFDSVAAPGNYGYEKPAVG